MIHELQTDTRWTAVGALHDGSLARVVEQWALCEWDVCSDSSDRYSRHNTTLCRNATQRTTQEI